MNNLQEMVEELLGDKFVVSPSLLDADLVSLFDRFDFNDVDVRVITS